MAKTFLTNINLKGNQLLNAVIHSASSAPSALAAGQLYFNTGNNTFYYSTGSGTGNWSPVGVQYIETVASPFVVSNGELGINLGSGLTVSAGDLTIDSSVVTLDGTQTLSNKTISDNLHFNSGSGMVGHIHDDGLGNLELVAATYDLKLNANQNITLTTTNGNIILNPDGSAYIGSASSNNRIATMGDLSAGSVQSVSGTTNQIVADTVSEAVTLSLPSVVYIKNTAGSYPSIQLDSDNEIIQLVSSNYDQNTLRLSNGGNNGLDSYVEAMTQDLKLQAMSGNIHLDADGSVYLDTSVYTDSPMTAGYSLTVGGSYINTDGVLSVQNLDGTDKFVADTTVNKVFLTNYIPLVFKDNSNNEQAQIYVDNNLILEGQSGIDLYSYNGNNIALHSDSNIYMYPQNQFNVGDVFRVDPNNVYTQVNGSLEFRDGGNTHFGSISGDNDHNVYLYGNNYVVLQPEMGNAYIGSVDANNKIVKYSDLTELSSGLNWKQAVNLLWDDSNAGLTGTTGTLVIDGHLALDSTNNGYRILITNGANAGIWEYQDDTTNWTLTRSTDADTNDELKGAAVFVMEGTQYGSTSWVQSNHYITGFSGQVWHQFSGQGTYTGSNSILLDGNSFSVILDSDSLAITGSGLKVNYLTSYGLDNDGGLYVKTAGGVKIDGSGNVAADYTAIESQLVTDGFVKSTDITNVTRKYDDIITGDALVDSFSFTHNLNTRDVVVRVYQTSAGADQYSDVEVDIKRTSTNAVSVSFATAPAVGENYAVVIIG